MHEMYDKRIEKRPYQSKMQGLDQRMSREDEVCEREVFRREKEVIFYRERLERNERNERKSR